MNIRSIARLGLALTATILLVHLTMQTIDVRLGDLDYLLFRASSRTESFNRVALLGRYELLLRRQAEPVPTLEADVFEARIVAVSSTDVFTITTGGQAEPARTFVNGLRSLLGKEIIRPQADDGLADALAAAYALQRYRHYEEAILRYEEILLRDDLDRGLRAMVLLNRAFSISLTPRFESAFGAYQQVIDEYPETTAAELAMRLLDLLNRLRREPLIHPSDPGPLAESLDNYRSLRYAEAAEAIVAYLESTDSPPEEVRARYYLARSLEETGQIDTAVREFERLIWLSPRSPWAAYAARRLRLLSDVYAEQVAVSEETRARVETVEDGGFGDLLVRYQELVAAEPTRANPGPIEVAPRELWIGSEYENVEIYLDGELLGTTPIVLVDPPMGPVRLEARSDEATAFREIRSAGIDRTEIFLRAGEFERPSGPEEHRNVPPERSGSLATTPVPGGSAEPTEDVTASYRPPIAARTRAWLDILPDPPSSVVAPLVPALPPYDAPSPVASAEVGHAAAERYIQLRALEDSLTNRYEDRLRINRRRRVLSWSSFGLAATGAVVAGTGFWLASQSYSDYLAAETEPAAADARTKTEQMTMLLSAGALGAVSGVAGGFLFRLLSREPTELREELELVRAERARGRTDAYRHLGSLRLNVSIEE